MGAQPTLPIKPGEAQRTSSANGTREPRRALEITTGEVAGSCCARHTHQEFLALVNRLVNAYQCRPQHVVLDNSTTHTTLESEAGWPGISESISVSLRAAPRG